MSNIAEGFNSRTQRIFIDLWAVLAAQRPKCSRSSISRKTEDTSPRTSSDATGTNSPKRRRGKSIAFIRYLESRPNANRVREEPDRVASKST